MKYQQFIFGILVGILLTLGAQNITIPSMKYSVEAIATNRTSVALVSRGTPVDFAGNQVGYVAKMVTNAPDGTVLTLRIDHQLRSIVRKASTARVTRQYGIAGDVRVELSPSFIAGEPMTPTDRIQIVAQEEQRELGRQLLHMIAKGVVEATASTNGPTSASTVPDSRVTPAADAPGAPREPVR